MLWFLDCICFHWIYSSFGFVLGIFGLLCVLYLKMPVPLIFCKKKLLSTLIQCWKECILNFEKEKNWLKLRIYNGNIVLRRVCALFSSHSLSEVFIFVFFSCCWLNLHLFWFRLCIYEQKSNWNNHNIAFSCSSKCFFKWKYQQLSNTFSALLRFYGQPTEKQHANRLRYTRTHIHT